MMIKRKRRRRDRACPEIISSSCAERIHDIALSLE